MRPGEANDARRGTAALAIACALISTLFAGSAQAAFPGFPGRIAFDAGDGAGSSNIFSAKNDGTNITQLTFDSGGVEEGGPQSIAPAWSADGMKLVFSRYDGSDFDIWSMNADGTDKVNLTEELPGDEFDPSFSYDGTRIVFEMIEVQSQEAPGDADIASMSAAGTGIAKLTNDDAVQPEVPNDSDPVFSQDGKIYFSSNRTGPFEQIFSMLPDGANQTQLTFTTGYSREPDPSPDGTSVVFIHDANPEELGGDGVFLMDETGGPSVPIVTGPDFPARPAFSPGTLRIIFEAFDGGNDLFLAGTGGGAISPVADTGADERRPDWQPIPYQCFGQVPTIVGSFGKDEIVGTPGADVIVGLGGNDTVNGKGGDDLLCGEAARDKIFGGKGDDRVTGGPGSDQLFGSKGDDRLFGGSPGAKGTNIRGDRNKCHGGPGDDKAGADCTIKVSIP